MNKAGFIFFLQDDTEDDPFWCVPPEDGQLDEVSLGTLSRSGGGGNVESVGDTYSIIRDWNLQFEGSGSGSNLGDTYGGGGGSFSSVMGSIHGETVETEDASDGECPDGKIEVNGECQCAGEKIQNITTGDCECPEGMIENDNGVCVSEDDNCETSKEELKKVFPSMLNDNAELLAKIINDKGKDFGIDSDETLWHFLSQAGHETGGFNTLNVTESTYWTTATKLAKTYSKFTMDSTLASTNVNKYYAPNYLRNSAAVANIAMCCNFGNGNVESGDGFKYRGRGLFQLTWKDNYEAFKIWYNDKYNPDIDPVTSPDIIATNDTLAILSGLWYYKTRVIDKVTIDSTTSVSKVTKPINPWLKGLKDRKERFKKAKDSINCL